MKLNRRSLLLVAAVSGLMTGANAPSFAGDLAANGTTASNDAGAKHACKGLNECKGKGGCKVGEVEKTDKVAR